MRETHPIDELFRESLKSASAQPPARVRAAVMASLQRDRRAALWRQRAYLASGSLLLLLGLAFLWYRSELAPSKGALTSTGRVAHEVKNPLPVSSDKGIGLQGPQHRRVPESDQGATVVQKDPESDTEKPRAEARRTERTAFIRTVPLSKTTLTSVSRSLAEQAPAQPRGAHSNVVEPPVVAPASSLELTNNPHKPNTGLLATDPEHISIRNISIGSLPEGGQPLTAFSVQRPLVNRGGWWAGIHFASYAGRYQWAGSSTRLVDALNDAETWDPSIGIGVSAGRRWRSGWGVGLGVEFERSEKGFRHEERRTEQERVITTTYVTLNTTVFATSSDTTTRVVERQLVAEGLEQRSVMRIPLEAFWHARADRWLIGARAGVATEFTSVKARSSLVQNELDGTIFSERLSDAAYSARYPTSTQCLLGLDLGFVFHERWALIATPLYMTTLVRDASNSVSAAPERTGVRFQLYHTL